MADETQVKWGRRLKDAAYHSEPVYVSAEEHDELSATATEEPPDPYAGGAIGHFLGQPMGHFLGQPVIVDEAKAAVQRARCG